MVCHVSISFSSGGEEVADFYKFPEKRLSPVCITIYVNTTLYRNSRISRLYCGKTIKDRGLSFGMVPTHILKAKTAKFQVLTPSEVCFSDTRFSKFTQSCITALAGFQLL